MPEIRLFALFTSDGGAVRGITSDAFEAEWTAHTRQSSIVDLRKARSEQIADIDLSIIATQPTPVCVIGPPEVWKAVLPVATHVHLGVIDATGLYPKYHLGAAFAHGCDEVFDGYSLERGKGYPGQAGFTFSREWEQRVESEHLTLYTYRRLT